MEKIRLTRVASIQVYCIILNSLFLGSLRQLGAKHCLSLVLPPKRMSPVVYFRVRAGNDVGRVGSKFFSHI